MVTTHSESEWRLLRSLRNQGRADSGGWLEHARLGFNYRIDDIRAAIGLGQLEKLDDILRARGAVAARYAELLADVPGLELPCADDADHERSWFVYVVDAPGGCRPRGGHRDARRARRPDGALPPVHPPAAVHAGAVRVPRRSLPGRRGARVAHARAPVPRAAGRGRPGVRRRRSPRGARVVARGPSQGEALADLARCGARSPPCIVVTYSRLDPSETYHVSRDGLAGGLSRALTFVNFPIALVAIALVLVAVAALPARAWWAAAPAIALCATIPLFNDQANLDAHWGNAVPAVGVAIAGGLTVAATLRAGSSLAPRRPWDTARVVVAVVLAARVAAVDQRRARVPLPRRRLHGRGARSRGRRGRSRPSTWATTTASTGRCSCSRRCCSRASSSPGARLRIVLQCYLGLDARVRRRQLRPGRLERAARQARMDGNVASRRRSCRR